MLSVLALALASLPAPQSSWYVDGTVTGPGSGTQSDPYATIQAAIDASATVDGDEIRIVGGDYLEELSIDGKRVDLVEDSASSPVRVVKTQPSVRALAIQNVPAPGLTVRGIEFVQLNTTFNGGGASILASTVHLDECRFEGHDDASGPSPTFGKGGGVYVASSSDVRVTSSVLFQCLAYSGNGLCVEDSNVEVLDSDFVGNGRNGSPFGSGGVGGAIFIASGTVTMRGSELLENTAFRGAGIESAGGTLSVTDTTFIRNGNSEGTNDGGGFSGQAGTNNTFERCIFDGNIAANGAGARGPGEFRECVFRRSSGAGGRALQPAVKGQGTGSTRLFDCLIEDMTGYGNQQLSSAISFCYLEGCTIRNCTTRSTSLFFARGGALFGCTAVDCVAVGCATIHTTGLGTTSESAGGAATFSTLTGCVLIGNTADYGGAAYDCLMTNCTLVANTANVASGGAVESTLDSCIVYDNHGGTLGGQLDSLSTASWSTIKGGFPGTGNISLSPMLARTFAPSLQALTAGSPCIDTGNPARLDPDGSRVDMGARPFDLEFMSSHYCLGLGDGTCEVELNPVMPLSLGDATWRLRATRLTPNTFGLAFVGLTPLSPASTPLTPTPLCIDGTLFRTDIQQSSNPGPCSATMTLSIPSATLTGAGVIAGQSVYAQLLYRASSSLGLGRSTALEAIVQP